MGESLLPEAIKARMLGSWEADTRGRTTDDGDQRTEVRSQRSAAFVSYPFVAKPKKSRKQLRRDHPWD